MRQIALWVVVQLSWCMTPASNHFFDKSSPSLDNRLDNSVPLVSLQRAVGHTFKGEYLFVHRAAWELIEISE